MSSNEYKAYELDRLKTCKSVLEENRKQLFSLIRNEGIDTKKLILLSHERLAHLNETIGDLLLHVFGHRHTFKHTFFKNTFYLNTSALDHTISVEYRELDETYKDDDYLSALAGTYGVLELNKQHRIINVEKRSLFQDNDTYECIRDFWYSDGDFIEEDGYYVEQANKFN